jgi:chromate transporter
MKQNRLKEVASVFLKLGLIGFGGPAVHIAMMEQKVVREREWMSHAHFIDLIGAVNLIPGPNSTEMALHIGHKRGGLKGLFIAGACFILPAVFITGLFAWAYQRYGALPQAQRYIYGIKPAVIGIIFSLMITLGRKALKNLELGIIGAAAIVLTFFGINDLYILFGLGIAGMLLYMGKHKTNSLTSILPIILLTASTINTRASNSKIFWIFLKVGALIYGSGYVLFAFLNTELVNTGMLSRQVLIDAIAVGQFTPGPVFSSATFIGWQMGGVAGALCATAGIFLPSFLFVGFLTPLVTWLRKSPLTTAFLDAVNIVSIALILAVCLEMGRSVIIDWKTIFIAVLGFAATFRFKKLNSALVVLAGSFLGYLLFWI